MKKNEKEAAIWIMGIIGVLFFLAGISGIIDFNAGIVLAIIFWIIAGVFSRCKRTVKKKVVKKKKPRRKKR